jgi:hypothetical protein
MFAKLIEFSEIAPQSDNGRAIHYRTSDLEYVIPIIVIWNLGLESKRGDR